MPATPEALAHVVYRTRRFHDMLSWYGTVFSARVQHKNPAMAFLTFDDEHHRFAFLDLSVIDPEGSEPENRGWVGVEFEPEAWLAAVRDGASLEDFRTRKIHEPVSPIRGEISALL